MSPRDDVPAPLTDPPGEDEIHSRLEAVRQRMDSEELAWLVVADPYDVFYLTNFFNFVHERPFLLLVGIEGAPQFIVPTLEVPHVEVRAVGKLELATYAEEPAPEGARWNDVLSRLIDGADRVGLEPSCPLSVASVVGARGEVTEILLDLRAVKSEYECGRLAHAARLVSAGHAELLAASRPGVPAIVLYGECSRSMVTQMLAQIPHANMLASSFAAVVQPPSISHDPHNFTDTFIALESGGPHVTVVNCRVDGYASELERTFFLGHVPDDARAPFDAMMQARALAFGMLRPGACMGDIDRAVRDLLTALGHADHVLHRTGHGIGVTGHEGPFLADGYEREVVPGMVFTIEPGIYVPGVGGFRHSDTVLVRDSGPVCLTRASVDLESLVFESRPEVT